MQNLLRSMIAFVFFVLVTAHLLSDLYTMEMGCQCSGGCYYYGDGMAFPIYHVANLCLFAAFMFSSAKGFSNLRSGRSVYKGISFLAVAVSCMVLSSFTDYGKYHSAFCKRSSDSRYLESDGEAGGYYLYWSTYEGAVPRISIFYPVQSIQVIWNEILFHSEHPK